MRDGGLYIPTVRSTGPIPRIPSTPSNPVERVAAPIDCLVTVNPVLHEPKEISVRRTTPRRQEPDVPQADLVSELSSGKGATYRSL